MQSSAHNLQFVTGAVHHVRTVLTCPCLTSVLWCADAFAWTHEMFVIHAGPQKPLARKLRDLLAALGIKAFVDQEDLVHGEVGRAQMAACLQKTPLGVAMLSMAFFKVEHRHRPLAELRKVLDGSKMLPVLLQDLCHDELRNQLTAALQEPFEDPDLRFELQVDRTQFIERVVGIAAVELNHSSQSDLEKVAWSALRSVAQHCVSKRPLIAGDLRVGYSAASTRLLSAVKRVAASTALTSLESTYREEASDMVLHLRDCLRNL